MNNYLSFVNHNTSAVYLCVPIYAFLHHTGFVFQYITHVHFYKNNVKYVDANITFWFRASYLSF